MLRSKKVWLGLAVSALFLALFLFRIDYSETFDALKGANYLYVAPAIAVYFGSLWFRTLRWQYLMKHLADVSISRLYPVTIVGYMANNIMPVRLGEVARSYYLSTRERMSASSALGTVGVDRVFDGLTLIFFILVVWPFLPLADLLKNDAGEWSWARVGGSAVVLVVFVGAIVVFVALTVRPSLTNRAIGLLLLFMPGRFRVGVRGLAETFIEGLGSLDSAKKVLVIFIMSLPVWIMESLMYYLITLSFGNDFDVSLRAGYGGDGYLEPRGGTASGPRQRRHIRMGNKDYPCVLRVQPRGFGRVRGDASRGAVATSCRRWHNVSVV